MKQQDVTHTHTIYLTSLAFIASLPSTQYLTSINTLSVVTALQSGDLI